MRIFLALLAPLLVFSLLDRPFSAIVCLVLQLTVIGWPLATAWALGALWRGRSARRGAA